MLSDEEKKAIEILKDREYDFDELYCTFRQSFIKPYDKSIGIILELIEKQQKEIEELKNKLYYKNLKGKIFINEDLIKAKIEELEKQDREDRMSHNYLVIPVLQSLLEKE